MGDKAAEKKPWSTYPQYEPGDIVYVNVIEMGDTPIPTIFLQYVDLEVGGDPRGRFVMVENPKPKEDQKGIPHWILRESDFVAYDRYLASVVEEAIYG